jgi:hypothetical protein
LRIEVLEHIGPGPHSRDAVSTCRFEWGAELVAFEHQAPLSETRAARTIIDMNIARPRHPSASELPAIRSIRPSAILATLAGALVVAAITALSLDAVPQLPAKMILGVSLLIFYCAALGVISPPTRRGPWARRPDPRPDDGTRVADDDVEPPSEAERVRAWRRARLRALGVPEHVALVLAEDPSFSHHELKQLLVEGCPLGTALRILWPT